jgi:hypothetical protein
MHVLLLVLALLILWPIAHAVISFIGALLLFALRFWVFVIVLTVVAVSWPSITTERERSRAASWREESGATAATLAVETAPEAGVDIPGEALRLFGNTQVEETGGWPVPSPHPIEEAALAPADQETSPPHDLGRGQTDRAPAEDSVRAPAFPPSAPTP